MNVLHVINNLRREGAQVQLFNQVTAAGSGDIRYSVFVRQPGGPLVGDLRRSGIEVIEPARYDGFVKMPKTIALLKESCRRNGIDLIHAHMADAALAGWLAARALELPLVISHHGQDILPGCNPLCRQVYRLLLMLAARRAAANIAVSRSVAARVKKLLLVGNEKLCVIANGVKVPPPSELEGRRDIDPDARLQIVNLGRLVPLKGQHQLISAMARIIELFPCARLTVVGGGECLPELQRQAETAGLENHIEFAGAVDDVGEYLAEADIYVSSSASEGMPVSLLEAMAWQLPVIASDIPGHRSVVSPAETGFLFELDNVADLVERLAGLATDAALAREVAARARAMVLEHYSNSVSEQRHAELYRRILQRRPLHPTWTS